MLQKKCSEGKAGLPRKRRKISNRQFNPHLNLLEKEQTEPKVSRREEIIKIREKINKIEIQKTIDQKQTNNSIKPRAGSLKS